MGKQILEPRNFVVFVHATFWQLRPKASQMSLISFSVLDLVF